MIRQLCLHSGQMEVKVLLAVGNPGPKYVDAIRNSAMCVMPSAHFLPWRVQSLFRFSAARRKSAEKLYEELVDPGCDCVYLDNIEDYLVAKYPIINHHFLIRRPSTTKPSSSVCTTMRGFQKRWVHIWSFEAFHSGWTAHTSMHLGHGL